MKIEPVDYAVISQAILAAAREMGAKLVKAAYSTILREARDGSAALFNAKGEVIAQAELIAVQLGGMSAALRPCLEKFPADRLKPGDFYVNNHPYYGGQHLQDVLIFTPIFYEGMLIGFSGTVAHHVDLGGGKPGINVNSTDIYQEGFIIPPSRYNYEQDWNGGQFERLLAANIRAPDKTIGDFNAQFASNAVGAQRMIELCEKYGRDKVLATIEELLDYGERTMRAAIGALPDGVYVGEDRVDDDGVSEEPLTVRASVTVKGDSLTVDFSGTCDQVEHAMNCPFSSTIAAALSCVKSVLTRPDIPINDGSARAIEIQAPYGSLLNPRHPAPVRARMEACYRAYDAVLKALLQAAGEKAIAPGFDTTGAFCLSHYGDEGYRVYVEVFGGGFGASSTADGADGIAGPLSNCSNTPIEALDMEFDFFEVTEYALESESAGHGRYRGGMGLRRTYRILKDKVNFSIYCDRFTHSAEGVFGGTNAQGARCEVRRGEELINVKSKDFMALKAGDEVTFVTGGGGGYGSPHDRPRSMVEADLATGMITEREAALYGLTPRN